MFDKLRGIELPPSAAVLTATLALALLGCNPNPLTPEPTSTPEAPKPTSTVVTPEPTATDVPPTEIIRATSTLSATSTVTPEFTPIPARLDSINAGGLLPNLGGENAGISYSDKLGPAVTELTVDELIAKGYRVNLTPENYSYVNACQVANPDNCYVVLAAPPALTYKGESYEPAGKGLNGVVEYTSGESSIYYVNWAEKPAEGSQLIEGSLAGEQVLITVAADGSVSSVPANAIFEVAPDLVDPANGHITIAGQDLYFFGGEPAPEKPLYSECGEVVYRSDYSGDPKGPDGKFLPTGLSKNWETNNDVFTLANATACVLAVDNEVDPNFGADAIRLKIGFYDTDGGLHTYPLMLGGVDNNGNKLRIDVCELQANGGNSCTSYLLPDALQTIQTHLSDHATRQIHLDFVTEDNAPWPISAEVNGMKPTIDALVSALETGTNFPEVPDGFFLVGWQIRLLN